ncbi:MAG: hypothetical protein JNK76_02235 [Planctomycetales bacterium]|nr:hypothetical protein [Planctomycetales bacterium]MBN8628117.1 hypothetical protein [Planctomycetota bacterium]
MEFELSRYPTVDYLLVIAPPPMCYYIAAYLKPRFEGKIEVKSSPWIGEPQVLQALDAKFYELLRQANRKAIARKP